MSGYMHTFCSEIWLKNFFFIYVSGITYNTIRLFQMIQTNIVCKGVDQILEMDFQRFGR